MNRVSITVPSYAEEIGGDLLRNFGAEVVEVKQAKGTGEVVLSSFFSREFEKSSLIAKVDSAFRFAFPNKNLTFDINIEKTEQKDWLKFQSESFGILRVTDNIVVFPPWKEEELEDVDRKVVGIVINPGAAFGTGEHPTTRCCIKAIEKYLEKGDKFLDVGAGSGVLSIVSIKLGAELADAIEIDEEAVKNGRNNALLNKIEDKVRWHVGAIQTFESECSYQMIAANIAAETILSSIGRILMFAGQETKLVFSGITREQGGEFEQRLKHKNLEILDFLPEGEWNTYVMEQAK